MLRADGATCRQWKDSGLRVLTSSFRHTEVNKLMFNGGDSPRKKVMSSDVSIKSSDVQDLHFFPNTRKKTGKFCAFSLTYSQMVSKLEKLFL